MKHSDIINGLILSIGKPEYSIPELVHLCKPFGISENSIRTYLSRSVKNGYFDILKEGRRAFYRPGTKMNRILSEVSYSFILPDWDNWNGEWWGVMFSVPEADKPKRYSIRKILRLYRFAPFAPGFWIRPRNENDELEVKMKEIQSDPDCRMLRFSYLDSFSNNDAAKVWDLKKINLEFAECIRQLEQ